MSGDVQVRFCERPGVRFLRATHLLAGFQFAEEAKKFQAALVERLARFSLKVEASKSQLIAFGRFAEEGTRQRGGKPETFDFLGFTFYCSRTRKGSFKVKRRTSAKKFRGKLKEFRDWLRRNGQRLRTGEILLQSKQKLEGHLQYYAITDNSAQCEAYRYQMEWVLRQRLNRRSQRRSYTWVRFGSALNWIGWPKVRIRHNLCPFRGVGSK